MATARRARAVRQRDGKIDGHTDMFAPYVRAGGFVFVSGQASVDEHGAIAPGTFAEEMLRSIDNVRRVLAQAGLTLSDVVKAACYVQDPDDIAEYNWIYADCFAVPRPARTTITSCLSDKVKFEIDVVAFAGHQGD